MNTFKRKSLHAAVLAGLGAVGLAGTANAVHVNPDGLGQVLIYPYFTTRADGGGTSTAYYDNYISLVNTTASTKAVKVRVLEGKRSTEVLDFNLYLSPNDVWTAAIVRTADGAAMISADNSCVVPNALFAKRDPATIVANDLNHFKNFIYAASPSDGGGTTLDRTREGYLEIIEMGDVTNATATAAAKHNSAGVPANCAYFQTNDTTLGTAIGAPTGGLAGGASLINVRAGTDFSYDATALANWHTTTNNYTPSSVVTPTIVGGNVATSTVFTASGNVVTSTWALPRDAVTAALMKQYVFNEWMLDTNTASGTDWVVTFPTKRAYTPVGAGAGTAPFNANFNNGVSCDIFTLGVWNREEASPTTPVSVLPSPLPPIVISNNTFCYEANVLTFANSSMLGSTNAYNMDPTTIGRNGWASVGFLEAVQALTPLSSTVNGLAAAAQTHRGLPAVGFMIQDFSNGNVGGVASNYGGLFAHKYFRSIGTTP